MRFLVMTPGVLVPISTMFDPAMFYTCLRRDRPILHFTHLLVLIYKRYHKDMRWLLFLVASSIAVLGNGSPYGRAPSFVGPSRLDVFLGDKTLAGISPNQFVAENTRFDFISSARDTARAYAKDLPGDAVPTFAGLPLVEALVRFDPAGNEVTMIVYSVGDLGEVSEDRFEGMVGSVSDALTKSYGKPVTPSASASALVRAKSLSWRCPAGLVRLEWSSTRANSSRGQAYRAEFIRVVISPPPVAAAMGRQVKWTGSEQVRTNPSGDKWIGTVPMVDQGRKGYCAVATSERVLRYYGRDADQHELAQVLQTAEGTSAQKFEDQMRRVASRFDLRFQVCLSGMDERFIADIVKDYAKAGKKKGGIACPPQLEEYPNYLYQAIDSLNSGQLVGVRQADKAGMARMGRHVKEAVDRGDPVIWCVHLGIVPEPGLPQAQGGHMRLIIGYNPKTSEILYTDSWGSGHELKRMKLADAWPMTFGMYVMKPN